MNADKLNTIYRTVSVFSIKLLRISELMIDTKTVQLKGKRMLVSRFKKIYLPALPMLPPYLACFLRFGDTKPSAPKNIASPVNPRAVDLPSAVLGRALSCFLAHAPL